MAKDPAVLFYIDKWLLATKEMKPDCKAWYHSLILHQYDKKSLPNDIEELANLADVRVSEYERFKQVFEDVLKHKFKENNDGRLVNDFALEIITNREQFKEKRSNAGKMSYFAKFMRKICSDENIIQYVLKHTDFNILDTKNEQTLKQVFKQKSELYISVSTSVNINNIDNTILLNDIMIFFNFTESANYDKMRDIFTFLNIITNEGQLEYFVKQFNAYKEIKKSNPKFTHSFKNFIGDAKEKYIHGAWNSENWEAKLKTVQINNQPLIKGATDQSNNKDLFK